MTRREIVEEVARKGWIEECIKVVTGGVWRPEHKDLTQDILLELLDLDSKKIISLYEKNQLRYYLMRVVRNNIQSKTSRFYYRYRRFSFFNVGSDSPVFIHAVDPDTEE